MNKINGVFEGGGVKGIALVGAAVAAEEAGYSFSYLAGTSAGAITAALLTAYTPSEVGELMRDFDLRGFADPELIDYIPIVGPIIAEALTHGLLKGDRLEKWLEGHLAARGIRTFHDLIVDETEADVKKRYRLHVIASDLTKGEMIVIPDDLPKYRVDIDSYSVAAAVRCSMALPFIFTNSTLGSSLIVDGGLYSNCPVWYFDNSTIPTVGFRLVAPSDGQPNRIFESVTEARALVLSLLDSVDKFHILTKEAVRCVMIPTLGISTIDFNLSSDRRRELYESGHSAATTFFKGYVAGAA